MEDKKLQAALEALHKADLIVGATPADGAHASLKDIRPFHKYMSKLIAEEVANDVLFVTERNENVWWYDGQRIAFRTATYSKILRTMQIEDQATQAYLQEETGINRSALPPVAHLMRVPQRLLPMLSHWSCGVRLITPST